MFQICSGFGNFGCWPRGLAWTPGIGEVLAESLCVPLRTGVPLGGGSPVGSLFSSTFLCRFGLNSRSDFVRICGIPDGCRSGKPEDALGGHRMPHGAERNVQNRNSFIKNGFGEIWWGTDWLDPPVLCEISSFLSGSVRIRENLCQPEILVQNCKFWSKIRSIWVMF